MADLLKKKLMISTSTSTRRLKRCLSRHSTWLTKHEVPELGLSDSSDRQIPEDDWPASLDYSANFQVSERLLTNSKENVEGI